MRGFRAAFALRQSEPRIVMPSRCWRFAGIVGAPATIRRDTVQFWISSPGRCVTDKRLRSLDYVPLPDDVAARIVAHLNAAQP